jgi:ATP-dependent DNA ligase
MLEGAPTTSLPLWNRRQLLEAFIELVPTGSIELAAQYRIGKVKLYHDSIEGEANEGIVLKQITSTYNASESRCLQNPHWLKVKRVENHVYTRR